MKGMVFDIQHYSIHDGPGIRTNVYLKGCPLHCLWCANPESQSFHPELMYLSHKCTGCSRCIDICPQKAIRLCSPKRQVATDRKLCTGCGKCVNVCTNNARMIAGKEMSVEEVYREVAADVLFYDEDGGMTITGGEVMAQAGFAEALLKKCRENGIRTAVETAGFAEWDTVRKVADQCDLVLYDMKHMDPEMHRKYTGQTNEKILNNLKRINDETNAQIWVRVPLIPGVNDSRKNLQETADFVCGNLSHCSRICLLPYHRLGESKTAQLEKTANGFESHVPDDTYMEELRDLVRSYGLDCR